MGQRAKSTKKRKFIKSAEHASIIIKERNAIEKMRAAGKLARKVLTYVSSFVKPGITTSELNDIVEEFTQKHNAVSAPLNYRGYPKSICTSVDNVVCHGIPDKKKLKEGQILNIDITVILDGYHGDVNETFLIGRVSSKKERLVNVARNAMFRGIQAVKPENTLGDVGYAIQRYTERHGFSVVRDFIGHGIGRDFHEEPPVHHVGKKGRGITLIPGMTFTVEPMINEGSYKVKVLKDKWTVVTADDGNSAQFENTVLVTETGVEVLTI
jgi:methionyl aminopeptidase